MPSPRDSTGFLLSQEWRHGSSGDGRSGDGLQVRPRSPRPPRRHSGACRNPVRHIIHYIHSCLRQRYPCLALVFPLPILWGRSGDGLQVRPRSPRPPRRHSGACRNPVRHIIHYIHSCLRQRYPCLALVFPLPILWGRSGDGLQVRPRSPRPPRRHSGACRNPVRHIIHYIHSCLRQRYPCLALVFPLPILWGRSGDGLQVRPRSPRPPRRHSGVCRNPVRHIIHYIHSCLRQRYPCHGPGISPSDPLGTLWGRTSSPSPVAPFRVVIPAHAGIQ